VSLGVYWDGVLVGQLIRGAERTREYTFEYLDRRRAISLSLPTTQSSFTSAESRPFFDALLPEGIMREQIAAQLKLAASDSYSLLAALGRDCAGALQVMDAKRMSDPVSARWLDEDELDTLIAELPSHPLGIDTGDKRLRLSLAGVQRKAVLVRDDAGRFGQPLHGLPSTHILKPDLATGEYPAVAVNEYFCMRLARDVGLPVANVELTSIAERPCLIVQRFDRDRGSNPVRRLHQEDLCQAIGITPDFKYQLPDWRLPSYKALSDLLAAHSARPGADRLAAAEAAVFHFLVGNADAHAKNISLLHDVDGVRLAPLYDVVSTEAYPGLNRQLALGIGDEFNPDAIGAIAWGDLAFDFGLNVTAFAGRRALLVTRVMNAAAALRDQSHADGWHDEMIDTILDVIAARAKAAGS
jgi:serine/threonine-protein kinase HipA